MLPSCCLAQPCGMLLMFYSLLAQENLASARHHNFSNFTKRQNPQYTCILDALGSSRRPRRRLFGDENLAGAPCL